MAQSQRPSKEFILHAPTAQRVVVVGSFNNWDPAKTPLRRLKSGDWKARVPLPPGRHEYRFVVDGEWMNDPQAPESIPNPYGGTNSVVTL